jgi:putative membrane protein
MKKSNKPTLPHNKSKKQLFGIGFGMGTADLVPGVSGGTIAFIFGIYEQLLKSIKTVTGTSLSFLLRGKLVDAWRTIPFGFLLPVAVGIVLAIFSLSNLISYLLDNYPVVLWSAFFGLVVGSIFVVKNRIKVWNYRVITSLIVGAVVTYFISGINLANESPSLLAYFVTGFIAFSAMILPGISGSLMMVLMGMYSNVINALSNRDFAILGILLLGGIAGVSLLARGLIWVFKNHHDMLVAFLIGMMVGSLRKLWPFKEAGLPSEDGSIYTQSNILPDSTSLLLLSVFAIIVSAVIIILIERKLQVDKED